MDKKYGNKISVKGLAYDEETDMITLITDKDIMSKGCKVLDLETMQMVEEIPVRKDCKNKLEVLEIKK